MTADEEELKINVDKRGRICDKNGASLRDRANRSFGRAPFKGDEGKPNPHQPVLDRRIKAFDALRDARGRTKPGSLKR